MEQMISKASLEDIKKIFPPDINLEVNRDLIGIVLNVAVAGRMNRNGDSITKQDALKIAKNFKNKYVNVEHQQDTVIGTIVNYGFSRFGNNELLTAEEIGDENFNEPFNISIALILWGSILTEETIEFIESSADPTSDNFNKISASWEIFYDDYDIALGPKNVNEAKIIASKEEIEEYQKYLKSNGGNGKIGDKFVYRVMKGNSILPAGLGLVEFPAAEVVGLELVTNNNKENENMKLNESNIKELSKMIESVVIKTIEEQKKSKVCASMEKCPECGEESKIEEMDDDESEVSCAKCDKKSMYGKWKNKNNISKSSKTDVIENNNQNNNDSNIMKIQLKSVKDLTPEVLKMEAALVQEAVNDLWASGIKEASDKWVAEKGELEKKVNEASESVKQKDEEIKALQENFAAVEKQLKDLNEKALAQEMETKFNERMEGFDAEFELTSEVRQILASDIKGISDEDYTKYVSKMKLLLPKKVVKSEASAEVAPKEEIKTEAAPKKEELSTASETVVSDAIKTADVSTSIIPNASDSGVKETLADRMKKAFSIETLTK
jgi:hypothetical protein